MIIIHPLIENFCQSNTVTQWSEAQIDDLKWYLMAEVDLDEVRDYNRAVDNQCKQHYREWARRKAVIGNHMHNYVLGTYMSEWQHPKRQEWINAKASSPDTIVLVQHGRFYEIFHEDADVLHRALQTVYMHGYVAYTGYPISCHDRLITLLREAGHNSVRII
jgi:hypothetical protein